MNKLMTPEEYIDAWNLNAKQHFDDGDYEWICDRIRQIPSKINKIFEIGCGSGYYTLTMVLRDFDVVSIDANGSAIEATQKLIAEHDYIPVEDFAKFIQADIVHDYEKIKDELASNPCDVILLCNPGGSPKTNLTMQEEKWLRWGNFTDDEFTIDNLHQLHTYAMIFASCGLALESGIPLLIVQRDKHDDILNTLQQIANDTGVRLINNCLRQIKPAPVGGITLSGDNTDLYWGLGLYFSE